MYSYALAIWARQKDVSLIEFYNEPDFDMDTCLTTESFIDFYLLRSGSIQNAYSDCNMFDRVKKVHVKIMASAFGRKKILYIFFLISKIKYYID